MAAIPAVGIRAEAIPAAVTQAVVIQAAAIQAEAIQAEAILTVFDEYVDKHGLDEIAEVFGKGVKIEVGDLLPSKQYADRLKRVPKAWDKAFEVNAGESEAVRASCVEFVLAGLYAKDRISRSQKHGRIAYEI